MFEESLLCTQSAKWDAGSLFISDTSRLDGEFFLGSAPGVPLSEVTLFPGQPVPENGTLIPSGDPGFGLGITLEDLERMKV